MSEQNSKLENTMVARPLSEELDQALSQEQADQADSSSKQADKPSKPAADKDPAPNSLEDTGHIPRPVTPEDESYRDLMMRFTAHPVKPKYWFEEFGDHWTCSCGQINKGETCANCGLERALLRQLFILHKPSSEGENPEKGQVDGASAKAGSSASGATGAGAGAGQQNGYGVGGGSGKSGAGAVTAQEPERSSHKGLIIGIIIAAVLLLLGTGAFLYFVVVPEMNEQDAAMQKAVKTSLKENLPEATARLPQAQYKSYVSAGNLLCSHGKYYSSLAYYNKAADVKNDESIQQKILDAKFGYVKNNENHDGYFETFLNELVDAGYDGAQSIYDQYYAWHVNIIANNLGDDFTTDMKNLNRNDTIYFHTTVTGGAPGETVQLYYQIIWPDGTAETKDVDSTWHAGSHFTSRFQYSIPFIGKTGKLTFELYDKDSHDLLGTDSVQLKK